MLKIVTCYQWKGALRGSQFVNCLGSLPLLTAPHVFRLVAYSVIAFRPYCIAAAKSGIILVCFQSCHFGDICVFIVAFYLSDLGLARLSLHSTATVPLVAIRMPSRGLKSPTCSRIIFVQHSSPATLLHQE